MYFTWIYILDKYNDKKQNILWISNQITNCFDDCIISSWHSRPHGFDDWTNILQKLIIPSSKLKAIICNNKYNIVSNNDEQTIKQHQVKHI